MEQEAGRELGEPRTGGVERRGDETVQICERLKALPVAIPTVSSSVLKRLQVGAQLRWRLVTVELNHGAVHLTLVPVAE
jgi:hypothetical protein